jgi:hypothetical protein
MTNDGVDLWQREDDELGFEFTDLDLGSEVFIFIFKN